MKAPEGPSTRLTFRVPASRRDELVAEAWQLGTRGVVIVEEGDHELVDVYFAGERYATAGSERHVLGGRCGAILTASEVVEDRDWLAEYRAASAPITVGPLRIDPGEPDPGGAPGDVPGDAVLRIPARNAFGTGSHESTRLILEGLIDLEVEGRAILDVGTGSGILALAALRRGAARVVGFDVDVGSVFAAADNGKLNRLAPRLFVGSAAAVRGAREPETVFDLVMVNILPHRWIEQAPAIVACVDAGGDLLVSGMLADEATSVRDRLIALGLEAVAARDLGEWRSLHLRRTAKAADAG